jgi:uncharacterized protein YcfJ
VIKRFFDSWRDKMNHNITLVLSFAAVLALTGCQQLNETQQDTLIGTGLGAGAGALIGGASGHAGTGAAIGAGVGAVTGAFVGSSGDNK